MQREELDRLRRLLALLQRSGLDRPNRKRTFMEVAGIGRREVSISKIISFLLDTSAEHGFGDLWARSILEAAALNNEAFDPSGMRLTPTTCSTEVVTANVEENLRIDVVMECPDVVLGIENKIGASLYNDLGAYAGQLADMSSSRTALLITLTAYDEQAATLEWSDACKMQGVEICNVTYDALFGKVKEGIGDHVLEADAEWLLFARDFMTTIENLRGREMQFDEELFSFMSDNQTEVLLLKSKMEEVTRATKEQGVRLRDLMISDPELSSMGLGKPGIWSPDKCHMWCCTLYDVAIAGTKGRAHLEISNDLDHMEIRAWVSNASAKAAVKKALADAGLPVEADRDVHLVVRALPLETEEVELVRQLKPLVKAVVPIVER